MADWTRDDTETLRKHRENFRRAIDELADPEFPTIHARKKAVLRMSLGEIERELRSRGEEIA
jgi:hypothetical protein